MSLSIMLRLCLFFLDSEPIYAYKRYAYNKKNVPLFCRQISNDTVAKTLLQGKMDILASNKANIRSVSLM